MYLKCCFGNFLYNEVCYDASCEFIFCKYQESQYRPFEQKELRDFCEFLESHHYNFANVEVVTSDVVLFDIYDVIRDSRLLPAAIFFNSPFVRLLTSSREVIAIRKFDYTPVAILKMK